MIRLISREPFEVEIEGHRVSLRPLTNGQRMALAAQVSKLHTDLSAFDKLISMVAPYVVSINGEECNADTLVWMEDPKLQSLIVNRVIVGSSLSESESKNSNSSPDTSSPAGERATLAAVNIAAASRGMLN